MCFETSPGAAAWLEKRQDLVQENVLLLNMKRRRYHYKKKKEGDLMATKRKENQKKMRLEMNAVARQLPLCSPGYPVHPNPRPWRHPDLHRSNSGRHILGMLNSDAKILFPGRFPDGTTEACPAQVFVRLDP
jgi:hypothetical protein